MSDICLYSYEACPFAQRTRMVLAEKQVDFRLEEIDLQNKPEGWAQISPSGKVPLLRHDGASIYESSIINEYLDEVFPEPPLLPPTPLARAQARIWMDYCDSGMRPAAAKILWSSDSPEAHAAAVQGLNEALYFLEREGLEKLGDGPYFFGEQVTLVDFQFLPFFERLELYEELTGYHWPDDTPRLHRWIRALCERPSVAATLRPITFHREQHQKMLAAMEARQAAAG
jgi:glutathione S-transferase